MRFSIVCNAHLNILARTSSFVNAFFRISIVLKEFLFHIMQEKQTSLPGLPADWFGKDASAVGQKLQLRSLRLYPCGQHDPDGCMPIRNGGAWPTPALFH
jgi:hypothetical protein